MTDQPSPLLITGATGGTATPVVRALTAAGAPVRAMVRRAGDAQRLPDGAEAVVADFDDAASLEAALDGVSRAYLVTPSSAQAQEQQVRFVELAAKAGVERLVLLSQLGARVDSPVRFLRYHAVVEDRIRELGLGHTILRPNLFFQGLFAFAGPISTDGSFGAPIGDAVVSAVDVRDIADVTVAALTQDAHDGATYTLTGPAAISHGEMAAAFSQALGRPVAFHDTPPADFAASLQGVLPPWQVQGLLEDYAHYARGEAAGVSDAVREVTGHEARSFATFVADHAAAFGG